MTVTAFWNERYYTDFSRFPTYTHFVIKSLTAQEGVIEVSARLIDLTTGNFIKLPLTLLKVREADLETLAE
jgi:hypothetical protein